jgi:hypothetical protein
MRGLLSGFLMLVLGAAFTWALANALEMRAETNVANTPEMAAPSTAKTHWMF